ncbi:hypothetical protein N7447_008990 [Penicillium robsamsonii]|uniref:uncharacterized protein n=1 Tax=Penicillium robsamsonii TaxID=1792511 RepID=UPI002548CFB7|nr:uncharacterized protein N7447_008990 [Penicillium robsamsonii]KAJ5816757.1 hypothetical protein N7447_008990 [Penicillium robsamsonii]
MDKPDTIPEDVWDTKKTALYTNVDKIKVLDTSATHYTPVTLINIPADDGDDGNSATEQDGTGKSPNKRIAGSADGTDHHPELHSAENLDIAHLFKDFDPALMAACDSIDNASPRAWPLSKYTKKLDTPEARETLHTYSDGLEARSEYEEHIRSSESKIAALDNVLTRHILTGLLEGTHVHEPQDEGVNVDRQDTDKGKQPVTN